MTPLEFVGGTTLALIGFGVIGRLFSRRRSNVVDFEVATKHLQESIREAFGAGMLCAADIATHEGQEELAGKLRKTVQYAQSRHE